MRRPPEGFAGGGSASGSLQEGERALGPPTVLAICLAAATFAVLASFIVILFGLTQAIQFGLYVLGVAIALPGMFAGLALWKRLVQRLGVAAASAVAAIVAGSLAAAAVFARLAYSALSVGAGELSLPALGLWGLGVGALAIRPEALPGDWLAEHRDGLWLTAAALLVAAIPAFALLSSIAILPALFSLLVIGATVAVLGRIQPPMPRVIGGGIDLLVIVLITLAAVDLVSYQGGDLTTPLSELVHHDFLLGPANDVLGGRGVLTETGSQYGVASIYFLAAWFLVAPIGYGTLSILNGLLLALAWSAAYSILRLAGCSRALGASVVALGLVGTVIAIFPFPVTWPQIGPLRFGLPIVIILLESLAARAPRRRGAFRIGSYLVLGLSAIWSLETFFYTALTLASILAWDAAALGGSVGECTRRLAKSLGIGLIACIGAHVLFAVVTLSVTGELPDWGIYLAYFQVYSTGLYSPSYLFKAWPLGLGVGLLYLASATGLVMIVMRRSELAQEHPVSLVAIAGATACGVGTLTYAVARAPSLPYVLTACFLLAGLWLNLAVKTEAVTPPRSRQVASLVSIWIAALAIGASWSTLKDGWERSALAHSLPGGDSLSAATSRLWDSPPIDFRAPEGERLLAEDIPGSGPALVLAGPDLTTEVLTRSERINLLPMAHPTEDDLIRSRTAPLIEQAVAELPPGTRMLTQGAFLDAPQPDDPLAGETNFDFQPVPLQKYALALIEDRFDLRVVDRGPDDFLVVELSERSS